MYTVHFFCSSKLDYTLKTRLYLGRRKPELCEHRATECMNDQLQTVYTDGILLLSIVQEGLAEPLVASTKTAGARGGTILLGRGTAENSILRMLGLGDVEKEVVLTILSDREVEPVLEELSRFRRNKRLACGIAMMISIPQILRHTFSPLSIEPNHTKETRSKTMDSPYSLISCIVNRGFADDVMEAARKAGASGGTILNARGTGKEEDVKFFGVQLVPEKEILLILVKAEQRETILQSIKSVPLFAQPGSGLAFCVDVASFITLGGVVKE